jgi:hypothetical protein
VLRAVEDTLERPEVQWHGCKSSVFFLSLGRCALGGGFRFFPPAFFGRGRGFGGDNARTRP